MSRYRVRFQRVDPVTLLSEYEVQRRYLWLFWDTMADRLPLSRAEELVEELEESDEWQST